MMLPFHLEKYARLSLVGALHLALIYALLHSMQVSLTIPSNQAPIPVTIPQPELAAPPLPGPKSEQQKLSPPQVYVPLPVIQENSSIRNVGPNPPIDVSPPVSPPTGDDGPGSSTGNAANNPPVVDNYLAPVVDMRSCEKPSYPAASTRNLEEGTTVLAMHISSNGQVIDTRIERSSGFRNLDRAAQTALARCSFKPGSHNGVNQASWAKVEYVWKLD